MKKLIKKLKQRYKFFKEEKEHKRKLKEIRKKDPFIY